MHKLLNFMLLVTLIVASCFLTGCGDTDDDWKNPIGNEPVLSFTLGIKQETIANSRAAVLMPQSITISGVTFNKSSNANNITYYTGNLTKTNLDRIYQIGYALMDFNNSYHTIASSFFREAYNGTQPTALLVLDTDFTTVITAQANGKDVIKPIVNRYDDPETKVTMELKLNEEPESVVLTVPQGLGTVSKFTNWVIVIDDKTAGKSKSFARGEYEKYYGEIPSNGNSLILVLTPEGKQMFTKGHTYRGELINLEVQFKDGTQKYLDVSQCIADNVIWNK